MNKKISIPIMPIIIVIIVMVIVAILVLRGTEDKTSKLSKVYNQMVTSQNYAFTRYDLEEKNKKIIYRKTDKTLIDEYNLDVHLSTLILEGDTYLIAHADKEYYIYPNNNLEEQILTDTLKKIVDLEYTTGKEKIYGTTYKYEEYNGVSDFMISEANVVDANLVKTRFYFKGNELVYLKTICTVENEKTGKEKQVEELQTVKVEYEVSDDVFKIPSDYAEN